MSSDSSKKSPQKSILKLLGRKKAVPVDEINSGEGPAPKRYAFTRTIRNMVDAGLAEIIPGGQSEFLKITPLGRQKLASVELADSTMPIPATWDGLWRIIILDLPEERKNEREALRYLLKKAGFACVKNSVWVSQYPFEHLFTNIKKDLGLSTELMIITTDSIDSETEKEFRKIFKK